MKSYNTKQRKINKIMERLLYSHTRVHTSYIYTYVAQVKILILIQDIILKSVDCQPHPISIWRRSQAFQPICHQSRMPLSLSLSPDLSLTIENKIGHVSRQDREQDWRTHGEHET